MKILVFLTDMPPLPGLPTSGTALRTFGLVNGLRAHGHQVVVAPPRDAVRGFRKSFDVASLDEQISCEVKELETLAFDSFNQADVVAQIAPDAILCGHWPAMMLPTKPAQPLVVDLAGPHLLERHFQGEPDHKGAALAKLRVLATADYFLVSGAQQRLYFLSFMLRAGLDRPEDRIGVITMPLPPKQPVRHESVTEYPQIVFGGVFLPWQDPSFAIKETVGFLDGKGQGCLKLIGGKHPNYEINQGAYARLFEMAQRSTRVKRLPMLPFDQFVSELSDCDVALDLMAWNLERQLAVTIRSTTYLWAGLPVIYNDFADLSTLITEYDAGWSIPPGDAAILNNVLEEIVENKGLVLTKAANARRLAAEVFSWDRAVSPLLKMLQVPEARKYRETDITLERTDSAEFPLFDTASVLQYFCTRIDGLCRVQCKLATHNRQLLQPLHMRLYRTKSFGEHSSRYFDGPGELLAETSFEPGQIKNNEWLNLDLPPINGSGGVVFCVELSSDESVLEQTASPWVVKDSPFPMLGFCYRGKMVPHASLCFRSYCAG